MIPTIPTRDAVRERYAAAARSHLTGDAGPCCSGSSPGGEPDPITVGLYEGTDSPSDAALAASLGCGNPTALADLSPGEDVLDLGSGGGLDVLLSARRVGPTGTATGLDMTDEMLELARRNQAEAGIANARFVRGRIEAIPLDDASVDVVISNCVINLSADKDAVIREAHRVLRPGGRFAVADVVLLRGIPDALRGIVGLWTGCISGALLDTAYVERLTAVGFTDASVEITRTYGRDDLHRLSGLVGDQLPHGWTLEQVVDALDGSFASAFVRASKPAEQ
ncbi:arsenite methyltransferase [Janibacter sp. YB324]|uniref:arsenite methyltransferase n=1 Tax=Janibacter sp. YB324 TaxID=2761047 RepID=UPI001CB8CD52|nr:arsenite methyltransferase [Janibacter sp. YB324]